MQSHQKSNAKLWLYHFSLQLRVILYVNANAYDQLYSLFTKTFSMRRLHVIIFRHKILNFPWLRNLFLRFLLSSMEIRIYQAYQNLFSHFSYLINVQAWDVYFTHIYFKVSCKAFTGFLIKFVSVFDNLAS